MTIQNPASPKTYKGKGLPFYLTIFSLVLEFGRPQESISGLGSLRLPGIIILLLAMALIFSGRLNLKETQTRLFMAILILMGSHVPFAINNHYAFWVTINMLMTFVGYLAIVTFVDSFLKFQTMINIWILIHIFLALTGFIKGGKGIGGFLGDENDLALTLNMVIPISFFLAMETKDKSKRILFLIITGIFSAVVVLTNSRGGFIGLVAVGLYCWIKTPKKVVSGIAIVFLILTMFHFTPEKYWKRMQTIQDEIQGGTGTGEERMYSWKAGWRMFLDYPVFGVGPGNFNWHFENYEPPEGFAGRLHGGRASHSLYFTLIPELGLVGVIIFILMLKANWEDRRDIIKMKEIRKDLTRKMLNFGELDKELSLEELRKAHYLMLALGGSLVGFLVSGTFISVLYYPNFWFLTAFTIALRKAVYKGFNEISELRVA